ncbi:hypothetical protein [Corallococcus carmarthensis]|uniref:hypothetical protein n=1 Tax=Corallococcus carmarthensis TaxID=2316728 RepID=UPI0011C46BC7|nr:hypothetical protein [Corallococcus carmarthensis]NOK15591.1 hypothetical protein [Corallococcus carmarthensis]
MDSTTPEGAVDGEGMEKHIPTGAAGRIAQPGQKVYQNGHGGEAAEFESGTAPAGDGLDHSRRPQADE